MKLRPRYGLAALLVNAGALAGVLLALAGGASWHRWGPTTIFLAIGTVAALGAELIYRLARLRARSQASGDVPRGVRLRKPLWLSLDDPLAVIDFGCPLAAGTAALGFAGVGVGILLTISLLIVGMAITDFLTLQRYLTIEPEGLRVGIRAATFLVPWKAIAEVERERAGQRPLICLRLRETASAVGSAVPDTPQNRRRVMLATYDGEHPGGKLLIVGWTGGLDAPVLARVIRAAVGRAADDESARPN